LVTTQSATPSYLTRFSTNGHDAFSDASEAKGGTGSGFGPHELLEASVACCINIWLRMYADKNEIPLSGVTAEVRLNRQSSGQSIFEYRVDLQGTLSSQQRQDLQQQAVRCPVGTTLLNRISFREMSSGKAPT